MADVDLKAKIPALAIGAVATVVASITMSKLGNHGTYAGLALGSVFSGGYSALFEKGAHVSKVKVQSLRRRPGETTDEFTQRMNRVRTQINHDRERENKRRLGLGAVAGVMVLLASVAVITAVEAVAHKPVAAIVNHQKASGFSVFDDTPARQPSTPPVSPSPSVSTPTPAPTTQTPTPTLTATPSITTTPAVTPVPAPTPTITTLNPAPTPTITTLNPSPTSVPSTP